jgi:hypothetical protein
MPFSFSSYGPIAILIMIGVLSVAELVKYFRKSPPRQAGAGSAKEGK